MKHRWYIEMERQANKNNKKLQVILNVTVISSDIVK